MKALRRIERYLDEHMIPFELVAHPHSQTSLETARAAKIDAACVAKGVLLEGEDCFMVAMIPADKELRLGKLSEDYNSELNLAEEKMVGKLFADCDSGVVPGLPPAWGIEMVWDDALMARPDIYLEVGDHERLIHVETRYLRELFGDAPHCRFTQPRLHHLGWDQR